MANSSDYYYEKGLNFLNDENYEEALMYIDKAIEMDKSIPDYWISKSKCFAGLKRDEEALECLDEGGNFISGYSIINYKVKLLCEQSRKFMEDGNFTESFFRLDSASLYAPDDEEVISLKIKLFSMEANKAFEQGEYESASEFWEKVIELDPNNPIHYYNKANSMMGDFNLNKNENIDENKIKSDLNENAIHYAERLMDIKNFDQVNYVLDNMDSEYCSDDILVKKGELLIQCCRYDDAIDCFDEAFLKLKEKFDEGDEFEHKKSFILSKKAACFNRKGLFCEALLMYDEAIKYYDEAIKALTKTSSKTSTKDDGLRMFLSNKSIILKKLSKFEDAIDCIDEALDIGINIRLLKIKIELLIMIGKLEEAMECYNYSIKEFPDEPSILIWKLKILCRKNKYDETIEFLDEYGDKIFSNRLIMIGKKEAIKKLIVIDEALTNVNKALDMDKNNEKFLDYKNKLKFEKINQLELIDLNYALENLNNLIENDDNNIKYLYHKARLLQLNNQYVEAEMCYNNILDLNL